MDEFIYSQSVHKDFHGIVSYLIKYLKENYGEENMEEFFKESAIYIYKPLIDRIKKNGLEEIKKHLEITFSKEDGIFDFDYSDGKLVFNVIKCPAIWQMKYKKFEIDKDFCKASTEIVNTVIAKKCGYKFKVEYDQTNGRCVQKFWKEGK